jgi:phage anti-repressor protein
MTVHRFPPDSDRACKIVAQRLEKLRQSRPVRRTLRKDLEERREELLSLRVQGLGVVDIAMAYQDILEDLGWPRPSLSYVIRLVSEVTAKGARSVRDQTRPGDDERMGTLIPVFRTNIGGVEVDAVNARDLHAFLGNKDKFATWIRDRIDQFGFAENQDVVSFSENPEKPQGGRPSKEYHLTLDMAKELAMVERTPRGKQARQYFIEIERRYYAGERPSPVPPAAALPDVPDALPDSDELRSADAPVDSEAVMDFLSRAMDPDASEWKRITFLDPFLPMPLHRFLALAQEIYAVLESTRPDPSDPLVLRREAIEEAARISGAHLQNLSDAFGGNRRGWMVWSRK